MTDNTKIKNQAYYELGYKASKEGNYEAAIEYYKKAIEVMPNDADSYNSIGNNLSKMKLYNESIKYFDKCLEISPNHEKAHKNKAISYMSMGLNRLARKELNEHIRIYSEDTDACTLLGIIEYEDENYKEAIKLYTKVIKMGSKISAYELAQAHRLRQCVYEELGEHKKAEDDSRKASEFCPEDK